MRISAINKIDDRDYVVRVYINHIFKEEKAMRKTWMLVAIVVVLHCAAISALFLLQGCGTSGGKGGEPRPVVMPPVTLPEPEPVSEGAAKTEPSAVLDTTVYVVKSGDSISRIAHRYGTSKAEIQALNNLADPNKIKVGQKLLLPGYASLEKPVEKTSASSADAENVYIVRKGDSLSGIAVKLKVSENELAQMNAIADRNRIFVGQKLVVPDSAVLEKNVEGGSVEKETVIVEVEEPLVKVEEKAFNDSSVYHVVEAGQDLASIAGLYLVSIEELAEVNGIAPDAKLEAGQRLRIP
jgi:LysM repeat protein